MTTAEIDALVADDKATDMFDLNGLVHTNLSTWQQCGVR